MGNLSSHFAAFVFLFSVGVWHLVSCVKIYLRTPREYSARLWHPFPRFKQLELYAQFLAILFAILYQFILSADSDPLIKGSTPVYRLATLQTAGVLLFFLVLVLAIFLSENTTLLPLPIEAYFLLVAAGFALECGVLSKGASITSGIEGKCESLLGITAGICSACLAVLAWQPKLFVAELGFSFALCLQGSWFLQSGFSLYVRGFIPEGCHRLLDVSSGVEGSIRCDLDELRLRALALLDLLYIVHVILVMIVTVTVYGLVAGVLGIKRYGGYEPLSSSNSDTNHIVMKGVFP